MAKVDWIATFTLSAVLLLSTTFARADQLYVYPAQGQSPQQEQQDEHAAAAIWRKLRLSYRILPE